MGTVRSLSALEGISSSAMKSLLIVVCALIVPLIGGSLSRDRLPEARNLSEPLADSPCRWKIMSVVLVNWLSDMKGVLGIAPVMIRSANACTLRSFVAFMLVRVDLIHTLQQ